MGWNPELSKAPLFQLHNAVLCGLTGKEPPDLARQNAVACLEEITSRLHAYEETARAAEEVAGAVAEAERYVGQARPPLDRLAEPPNDHRNTPDGAD